MFDLLVKGGTLPDGSIADIAITGDRIAAVGQLDAPAAGPLMQAVTWSARPLSIRISIWTQPCPMVCRA